MNTEKIKQKNQIIFNEKAIKNYKSKEFLTLKEFMKTAK